MVVGAADPAAEGPAPPKRFDAGLAGSVVAAPEAGLFKPENIEAACGLAGSEGAAVPDGLLRPENMLLACAVAGAAGVDVAVGVAGLFRPENNEDVLAGAVGVVLAAAPPKRGLVGFAADGSAGFDACWLKSEVVPAGVALGAAPVV